VVPFAFSHKGTGRVTSSEGVERWQCCADIGIQFAGTLVNRDDTPLIAGASAEELWLWYPMRVMQQKHKDVSIRRMHYNGTTGRAVV